MSRRPQLFDASTLTVESKRRSRELVRIAGCPACGGPLTEAVVETPALFIHGGYGATRRSTWAICPDTDCRWSIERVVEETRPEVRPPRLQEAVSTRV